MSKSAATAYYEMLQVKAPQPLALLAANDFDLGNIVIIRLKKVAGVV
ncbi:MAG: hypothetical protein HN411_00520 [Waddliaceae bacterium]|jgi:hypothetical protein|nr:hypothetical protein [Waddliaceae bacterium]MBT3579467.1 hypothetical protein [Waddliaceae bacterium]MBT4445584.1 hypothetical protein [Waddliaceae bacterium]MBT6928224.1 hypothetical protein [Waddliaceae bacterium]MBT7264569.1 hypothetical protein [Waddliaceae bacterium]